MIRRARTRANARPWNDMSSEPDEGEEEQIGDWSSDVRASANQTENA